MIVTDRGVTHTGSTVGLPFPIWRSILANGYGLHSDAHRSQSFNARIDIQDVGDIKVADVHMRSLTIESRHRSLHGEDVLLLKLLLRGSAILEQAGEQQRFNPGNLVIVDPSRSFAEIIQEDTQMLVVTCKKSSMRERGYRHSLNRWIAADALSPDVHMVRELISLVAQHGTLVQDTTKERLSHQLLDMLDVVTESNESSKATGSPDAIRFRVKRYIAQHLGDENLDAKQISAAVNLSVGYLNRLFRAEQTSLIRYLWSVRLERGHQMLSDPSHSSLRIEQVAWLCGFSNPAHFSRAFRQRFEYSPSDLRASKAR